MAEIKGNRASAKKMMASAAKEIEVSDKDLKNVVIELEETKELAKSLLNQVVAQAEELEALKLKVTELQEKPAVEDPKTKLAAKK